MRIFILDGKLMTGRKEAYDHIAEVMILPEYFGHNLDALADCLSELDDSSIVILNNSAFMMKSLEDYGEKLLDTFRDSSLGEDSFVFIER